MTATQHGSIIEELINASRKAIKAAIEAQDAAAIQFCMNYLKAFRAGMLEGSAS